MLTAKTARQESQRSCYDVGMARTRKAIAELSVLISRNCNQGGYAASVPIPETTSLEMYRLIVRELKNTFKKDGFKCYLATWEPKARKYLEFGVKW